MGSSPGSTSCVDLGIRPTTMNLISKMEIIVRSYGIAMALHLIIFSNIWCTHIVRRPQGSKYGGL